MKWIVLGLLVIVAGFRCISYYWPVDDYMHGDFLKLNFTFNKRIVYLEGVAYVNIKQLWVMIPKEIRVEYGDQIEAVGRVNMRLIDNKQAFFISEYRRFLIVRSADNWSKKLRFVRSWLIHKSLKLLPGDEGVLMTGILLGGSEGFTSLGLTNFRNAGLTHILAASGYNVIVISGWIMAGLSRIMNRRLAILFGILCIVLYVILAGGTAAVVRAGIMAAVSYIGVYFGRKSDSWWLLGVTSVVMVLCKPDYIMDIGFQLSVLATAGLIMSNAPLHPPLSNTSTSLLHPSPDSGEGNFRGVIKRVLLVLGGDFRTTLAAQIMTLPILIHYFDSLNLISVVSNTIVLWTIPLIMQIAAVALCISIIWFEAGQLFSFIGWPLLKFLTLTAGFANSVPLVQIHSLRLGWEVLGIYYAIVLMIYVVRST